MTSDSDAVEDAVGAHHYTSDPANATSLALTDGQCDINSGDTYFDNIAKAVAGASCPPSLP